MVDRAALEMRSTRKGTGGSNPSLSAKQKFHFIINNLHCHTRDSDPAQNLGIGRPEALFVSILQWTLREQAQRDPAQPNCIGTKSSLKRSLTLLCRDDEWRALDAL